MTRLLVVLIALLAMPVAAPRAQSASEGATRLSADWRRVVSGDVVAVGDASEKTLREAVEQIASFRAAFRQLYPTWRLDSPVPYRVVRFESPDALRRYAPRDERGRPQQFIGGYFSADPDLNVIAIGSTATETVFHEFTHSFLAQNFHSLPLWLNEGLAEFHATFDADWQKGQSLMGRAPAGRLQTLRRGRFLPLKDVILASPADIARYWRDGERIQLFYAESWALVHYLHIGRRENKPGAFSQFVNALQRGTAVEAALQDAFGATVEQLDGELRRYVRRPGFLAMSFELVRSDDRAATVERMTEADVKYIKGDLLNRVSAYGEAEKELTGALALEPSLVSARVALAATRLALDQNAEALNALQAIVAATPDDFAATYHLGRALMSSDRHLDAIEAYTRATRLLDASPYAWYGLSLSTLAAGRLGHSNAAMTQAQLRRATPAWYRTRAYAALRHGLDAAAAADARRYLAGSVWDASTVYTAFVAAIAHRRLRQDDEASAILGQARQAANVPEWTVAVIDYLDGRLAADAFLRRARDVGERTEAHTYIGLLAAAAGRTDEARMHLRWVRENGAPNYVEFGMAKAELARLETPGYVK